MKQAERYENEKNISDVLRTFQLRRVDKDVLRRHANMKKHMLKVPDKQERHDEKTVF